MQNRATSGELATSNQVKADVLSEFFCSVFMEDTDTLPSVPCIFNGEHLEDVDVSPQKVVAKLVAFKPNHTKYMQAASTTCRSPFRPLRRSYVTLM